MTDAPTHDELGTLDQRDGRWELTFVRRSPHPVEKVWRADHRARAPVGLVPDHDRRRPGGRARRSRFSFPFPDAPTMEGEVLAFDPHERFEFRWGDEIVAIELTPLDDGGCELRLVNRFDEVGKAAATRPAGTPASTGSATTSTTRNGRGAPTGVGRAVHPIYVERLGPEASVIGPARLAPRLQLDGSPLIVVGPSSWPFGTESAPIRCRAAAEAGCGRLTARHGQAACSRLDPPSSSRSGRARRWTMVPRVRR